jgi:hypothetical protein
MFNAEQRGLATDEHSVSLVPVVISLLNIYAGLSLAVAGFVLDNTAMVVAGIILVGSGPVLIKLMAKAMNRSRSAPPYAYEKGEQRESLHPSRRPLMPSVKSSASPSGSRSIRTASMRSPSRLATISGSTSTSSELSQRSRTAF